jgi:hypothetical protein
MKKIMGGLSALAVVGGIAFAAPAPAHATGDVAVGDPCAHYQNNRVMQAGDGTWVRCVLDRNRPDGVGYTWVPDTGVPGPDQSNGSGPAVPTAPGLVCYDPPTPGCPPRGLTPEQRENW